MRKVEFLFVIVCLITLAVYAFRTVVPNGQPIGNSSYEFRVATSEDLEAGNFMGAQICHIYNTSDYDHDLAIAYGQARSLFGEPAYTTEDLENLYEYNIVATDKKGNEVYLYIYNGPTGPAIGGDTNDPAAEAAAKQLVKVIQKAEPADFYCEAYYFDGPTKLTIEVKNGKPKVTEVPLNDEQFEEMYYEFFSQFED